MALLVQVVIVLILAGAGIAVLKVLEIDDAMKRIIRIVIIAAVVIWLLLKLTPLLNLG